MHVERNYFSLFSITVNQKNAPCKMEQRNEMTITCIATTFGKTSSEGVASSFVQHKSILTLDCTSYQIDCAKIISIDLYQFNLVQYLIFYSTDTELLDYRIFNVWTQGKKVCDRIFSFAEKLILLTYQTVLFHNRTYEPINTVHSGGNKLYYFNTALQNNEK